MTQVPGRPIGPVRAGATRSLLVGLPRYLPHRERRAQRDGRHGDSGNPGPLTHHLDDVIDQRSLIVVVGILIHQVRVVATKEPDPQHDSCHVGKVARAKPGERLAGAARAA